MPDQYSNTRRAEPILSELELYSEYRDCDRWAVIVGISKYKYSSLNLRYADRDAEYLYQLLLTRNGGNFPPDNICKLTNEKATTQNINRALRSFLKKPAREDLVLIYFACHGSPDPDRPNDVYLLTHDTDPRDIAGTALPMEVIDGALKRILHSKKVIILADTCHSAAIGGGIGGRRSVVDDSKLMNRFLQEISQSQGGVALLTSAEANEVSFEDMKWGGGHGVFTHYLLEGMRGAADRDGDGLVTVGELFEYVRDNVKKATDHRQHPSIGQNAYRRDMPISIAPKLDFSRSSGTQQQTQNSQGSRSSAAGQQVQENLDITFEIALTTEEMSAGTEKHIVTEHGGITVKIPAGVSPGKRIRVRGKGRLDASTQQQGDLYLLIVQRGLTKEEQQIEAERQQNEQRKQEQERQRQEQLKREATEKQRQAEEEEKQRRKAEQLRQQRAAEAEATRLKQQEQLNREANQKRQEQAKQPLPDGLKGNYAHLEALLKAGKWKEADQETAEQMCQIMGRQQEGWLRVEDIKQFPCADLRTIDRLWVKYSNGQFGFSIQKQIWQECSSPELTVEKAIKFGNRIGWRTKGLVNVAKKWKTINELTFNTSAPPGHLPAGVVLYEVRGMAHSEFVKAGHSKLSWGWRVETGIGLWFTLLSKDDLFEL